MKINVKVLIATVTIITITMPFLAGCSPSVSREEAEKELVAFMINRTLQNPDGGVANYVSTSGQPWLNTPSSAVLVVYSPAIETKNKNPWEQIKFGEPIKVWWYFDNKLVEVTDQQMAIEKYAEAYIYNNSHNWNSTEFGILSISRDNTKAIIYESSSCGSDCAGGVILTVERNDSGKWEIMESELLWLS